MSAWALKDEARSMWLCGFSSKGKGRCWETLGVQGPDSPSSLSSEFWEFWEDGEGTLGGGEGMLPPWRPFPSEAEGQWRLLVP